MNAALAIYAQNQFWEAAKGPYGGGTDIITKTGSGQLYAVEDPNLVYRSYDAGLSWVKLPVSVPPPNLTLASIRVGLGGSFFAYCYNNRWYRSTDEGQTWVILDNTIQDIRETQTGVLIAVRTGHVWRSANNGNSWTAAPTDLYFDAETNIFTTSNEIAIQSNQKLFRSQTGLNWSVQQLPNSEITDLFITPSGVILGVNYSEDKVYRSTDDGATFSPVLTILDKVTFAVLNSGKILAQSQGAASNLYASIDQGATWTLLEDADGGAGGNLKPIGSLSGGANGTLLKEQMDALLRSSDGGLSWQFSGNGLRRNKIYDVKFVSDTQYYALTRYGLWQTNNAGEDWQICSSNLTGSTSTVKHRFDLTPSGGLVYINDDKTLQWSTDFGQTFTDITPSGGLQYALQFVFINPADNAIYTNGGLGNEHGMLRTTNLGQSWELVKKDTFVHGMVFYPTGRIIANCSATVLVSDDGGDTWAPRPGFSPTGYNVVASATPNGDIFISRGMDLWKSVDAGDTWFKLPFQMTGNTGFHRNSLAATADGHLYALSDDEIFLSLNGGLSWQNISAPPSGYPQCYAFFITPGQRILASFYEPSASYPYAFFQSTASVTEGAYIEGHVNVDADADCTTPDAQEPLKNRLVSAQGENYSYYSTTVSDGHYIFFVDTGAYQVIVSNPNSIWWAYCEDTVSVYVPALFTRDTADFVALPLSYCPLMSVNVGIPHLLRCFDNEIYVEYCNQGTVQADSAWVDVILDPYLTLVNAPQPYEILGPNILRFFVGDIPSGECNQLQLTVHLDCDSTVLGQTHCVSAHGYPDTLCTTVPSWSGAQIEASVACQDTTLQFTLRNAGSVPSADLNYIIIEDDIVLLSGHKGYDVAEDLMLNVPANGHTWRIESEQEPGHPFSNLALAFAEGCGGFNTLGYINQFTVNGFQPSWHRMCVESVSSLDPNDKQGFPKGFGSEHNIRPGQTIDYLVRFQNTGTAPALTVFVSDTLSPFLDPLSIRPGASSHPYTWDLSGQGVLTFRFNNILLPDSNVNEVQSHGFVQFSIAPFDVPLGSVIENSAAIYFDFNEPVITNTTWHTIQKSPLSSTINPQAKAVESGLAVWPNPFPARTNIHVRQKTRGVLQLNIYNQLGQLVTQKMAAGPDIEFNATQLPAGMYWAEVRDANGKILGNEKLVKE